MAPPYDAISRRNLQELESDLARILRSPPPPPPPPVSDVEAAAVDDADAEGATPAAAAAASIHNDMARRFEFLKNLITLEEESLPGDKPEHLDHTKDRLAFLEDAYHRWLLFGTTSSPLAETPLDAAPPCACTSSCFDEGDGDEWMEELSYDETPPPAEEEHVEPAAVPPCVEEFGKSTEDTRSWAAHGRKVCALGGAVKLLLLAAAAGVSLVLTSMWAVKDEQLFVLVPT